VVKWRFAEGRFELFSALAEELVRLNVDAIVVGAGSTVLSIVMVSGSYAARLMSASQNMSSPRL